MTHLVQFQNLRKEVEDLLKKLGAFKIRVADPQKGFDRALEAVIQGTLWKIVTR